MKPLKLPPCSLRIKEGPGTRLIWDSLRKKYVALTPEEWVRQHVVNYLTNHLGYPSGLIQAEASFVFNKMRRRADILVCDRGGLPVMIIECKAAQVKIEQSGFDQVINYNYNYGVRYLVITNGITHLTAKIDTAGRSFIQLDAIPDYETVITPER